MRQIVHDELPIVKALLLETLKVSEYRSIERLGGMTNHTYKVELWNGDMYVVRIPGAGTEKLIDRAAEKISALLACRLGIDAQIISFGEGGEKVSAYIQGAITLKEDDFSNPEMLEKVAAVFRKLHDSGADTGVSFDFFDMVSRYESNIQAAELKLFDDYEETKTQIIRLKAYIDKHAICRYVPCHNDPLCENWVMDSNGKLHLIDWEYAGMNDPMWDLADFAVEAVLLSEQENILLQCYFGRKPERWEALSFFANKLYLDFLWSLWGLARAPYEGESMTEYGAQRYGRLKRNLSALLKEFTDMELKSIGIKHERN